ncbi:hypothetical protein BH23VER1_BH23VER1_12090 [soil metagenome]
MNIHPNSRKKLVTHGAWIATAGLTFYLGMVVGGEDGKRAGAEEGAVRSQRVQQLEERSERSEEKDALAGGLATTDPGGSQLGVGAPELTPRQIVDLAREAFQEASQLKRSLAFSKLLESLTAENALEIRDAMREMGAGRDEWQLFTYAWGAKDGEAALAHAESLEGRGRQNAIQQSLMGWASADPSAALSWLEGQGEIDDLQRLRGSLIGGMADRDIALATDQAYKFAADGDTRASNYLEEVAEEKLRTGGHLEAASWAAALRDGPLKGAALDRVGGRYVREDPEAAARWATEFASTDYGTRVIEEIGDEWAERESEAAVAWLDSLPDGAPRNEGMESAFDEWADRDPRAASEYLAKMPPSAARDSAVNGFAAELSEDDPLSAVVWAETIGQDDLRIRALTRVARNWYQRDAATALEWLESANLPPESVRAVVDPRRRGRRGG